MRNLDVIHDKHEQTFEKLLLPVVSDTTVMYLLSLFAEWLHGHVT